MSKVKKLWERRYGIFVNGTRVRSALMWKSYVTEAGAEKAIQNHVSDPGLYYARPLRKGQR